MIWTHHGDKWVEKTYVILLKNPSGSFPISMAFPTHGIQYGARGGRETSMPRMSLCTQ